MAEPIDLKNDAILDVYDDADDHYCGKVRYGDLLDWKPVLNQAGGEAIQWSIVNGTVRLYCQPGYGFANLPTIR